VYPQILITDDHVFNIEAIALQLRLQGIQSHQIERAFNGLQAVNAVKTRRKVSMFNVIFMDCNMPHLDGYQATR